MPFLQTDITKSSNVKQFFQAAQDDGAVVKGQSPAVLRKTGVLIKEEGTFQGGGEDLTASLQTEFVVKQPRPDFLPARQENGEPSGIAGIISRFYRNLVCVQDRQMGAAHDPGAGISPGL